MSRYTGKQGRKAARLVREQKRKEALERNAKYRLGLMVTAEDEKRLDDQVAEMRKATQPEGALA